MNKSLKLATFLPAALALSALAGCAHGTAKKSERAAPRPAITSEDIARSPGMSIEQLLIARVPGLMLTRGRDGHTVMHFRGISTLSGEQQPLFIVDGVPLGDANNLQAVNRFDIASIEVLRDAASTAMYGLRGANGVIIIKTKS